MVLTVAGAVGTITLNRPDKMNAFDHAMVDALVVALDELSGRDDVRVVVLTGAGRAFCAGGDVALLRDIVERQDRKAGKALVDGSRKVHELIRELRQPVIASLNGVAAGGGANLALGCDLRIASDAARIGQVFTKIGLHPDWGGTYFLPRMVGTAKAFELFLSAELVEAPRLLELGLVNRVVPAANLAAETRAWAEQIAAAPPVAVRHLKAALYRMESMPSEKDPLMRMLDFELEAQLACFKSEDAREGLSAFFEKREPRFTGR